MRQIHFEEALNRGTNATPPLVLRFSGKAGGKTPATLHAKTCTVVAGGSNRRRGVQVIDRNVDAEVADLEARGFVVKRCACCR